MINIPCPKCGFESPESAKECSRCGIIFGKWVEDTHVRRASARPAGLKPDLHSDEVGIGSQELKVLAIGLVLAVIVNAVPFIRFIFGPIQIIIHELGHAIAGWLFGYPAIPSFDFIYGGGITPMGSHQVAIAILVAGGFAYLAYLFRGNRRTLVLIGSCFLVWLFFEASGWRRDLAISAAGHINECVFAGIFLYMALANIGWRMPEVERPLGAFLALFLEINMIRFCLELMHDQDALEIYKQGKGGMLMHDVDAVSSDLIIHTGWHPSIQTLAFLLLLFSFVPLALAVLVYLRRGQIRRVVTSLLYVVQADGPGGG